MIADSLFGANVAFNILSALIQGPLLRSSQSVKRINISVCIFRERLPQALCKCLAWSYLVNGSNYHVLRSNRYKFQSVPDTWSMKNLGYIITWAPFQYVFPGMGIAHYEDKPVARLSSLSDGNSCLLLRWCFTLKRPLVHCLDLFVSVSERDTMTRFGWSVSPASILTHAAVSIVSI